MTQNLLIRGKVKGKKGIKRLDIEGEHYVEVKEAEELDNPQKGGGVR